MAQTADRPPPEMVDAGLISRSSSAVTTRPDASVPSVARSRCAPTRPAGSHLTPAGPGHPWTGAKFSSAWGTRDVLDTTLVQSGLVAEISAGTSVDRGGVYRHPIRYVRLRLDRQ